ncbi:MAG TPA: hypothetical protein VFR78_19820 [Pyrinomonadaceae bacterium]|nr:hypothetical protein [Pyrinomonadaceae bacterium]
MSGSLCKQYFARLAAGVWRLWKEYQYDEAAFSDVAVRMLTEEPPADHVSFIDVTKFGLFTNPLPFQTDIDSVFGQPPLTVHWQPEFRIEVLFWRSKVIGIHQHAFSGAFHLLTGSSLHTVWDFKCEERVSSQLLLGALDLKRAELLRVGDTTAIVAGNRFIHATHHFDRPTVTVVIRTNSEKNHRPQYSYLEPFIAYDPLHGNAVVRRRLQLLQMLSATGRDKELLDAVRYLLDDVNHHYAFLYLVEAFRLIQDETKRSLLLSWAGSKHGGLVESFRVVLDTQEQRDKIWQVADESGQGDLKFFTALLRNVPRGGEILKIIRDRFPQEDPLAMIDKWKADFSRCDLSDVDLTSTSLVPAVRELFGCEPSTSAQAVVNRDEDNAPVSKSPAAEHAAVVS